MDKLPKKVRAGLRQMVGLAWRRELEAVLGELEGEFASWRAGEINAFDLAAKVAESHEGPIERLIHTYGDQRIKSLIDCLAIAVHRGIVSRDEVPPDVLATFADQLEQFAQLEVALEERRANREAFEDPFASDPPDATLEIYADDLVTAMEDHTPGLSWFLDRESGELIPSHPDYDDFDEDEEDEENDQLVLVDTLPSHDGFRIMERFAARVEPPALRDRLQNALLKPKPFGRFKQTLFEYPEQRDAWFAFHLEEMKKHARAWLQSEGIAARLVSRVIDD